MRFQTPQFIEVEDKIFGPLTLKQFIYLAGSAGATFLLYRTLPFFLAALLILPIAGLGLMLAFYKINNKPFIFILEAAFKYLMSRRLYVWRKEIKKTGRKKAGGEKDKSAELYVPKLSDSKLKDLAWSLDIYNVNKNQRA
jgi:hypothetical protein